MSKKVPKNVSDLMRLRKEHFPGSEEVLGVHYRYNNTVEALKDVHVQGSAILEPTLGKKKTKDPNYVLPYLFSSGSMEYVREKLPALDRKEKGVVKVSDVVRAMWLMIYRGPIVALASLHKRRVKNLKATLFGEGAKKIVKETIARKIGVEAAKELMKKLTIVKAYIEKDRDAAADEDALRAAAGRTIGEFIEARLPRPAKITRYTRWERTRK